MVDEKKTETDNRDFAEILITDMVKKSMGDSLDIMRMSEMSDRAFTQASRTLKDRTNELLIFCLKELKTRGYIKNK